MALIGLDAPALPVIPQADTAIQGPGKDVLPVGRPADIGDRFPILIHQRLETLARHRVPDPDQAIGRTTTDHGPIAQEIHATDGIRVGGQGPHHDPARGPDIPQEDGLVIRARDEHVPLGTEGQAVDEVVMAQQGDGMRFRGRHVPEPDRLVVRARRDGGAVGGPGQHVDAGQVAGQGFDEGEGRTGGVDLDGCVG